MLSLMYAGEMCYWYWEEASKTTTQDVSTEPSANLTDEKNEIRCVKIKRDLILWLRLLMVKTQLRLLDTCSKASH